MKTVTLQPVAMIRPNSKCIYAPSRIQPKKTISQAEFAEFAPQEVWVSFAEDGVSDPQLLTAYGLGLDCWYLIGMAKSWRWQ